MARSAKSLVAIGAVGTLATIAIGVGVFIASGTYYVGADEDHTDAVSAVLQTTRERSVDVHAAGLQVPDLTDRARIVQGAGNYDAMCVQCHGSPGSGETELSRGLNPAPPDLSKVEVDAAEAFWVIKHGIRMTGMPAWGESMADDYIWNMVAFVEQLPRLDAQQYQALVASSDGHSHGGGESGAHAHDDDGSAPHPHPDNAQAHGSAPQAATSATGDGGTVHLHADGATHLHEAEKPKSAAPAEASPKPASPPTDDAHDGHDHEH